MRPDGIDLLRTLRCVAAVSSPPTDRTARIACTESDLSDRLECILSALARLFAQWLVKEANARSFTFMGMKWRTIINPLSASFSKNTNTPKTKYTAIGIKFVVNHTMAVAVCCAGHNLRCDNFIDMHTHCAHIMN